MYYTHRIGHKKPLINYVLKRANISFIRKKRKDAINTHKHKLSLNQASKLSPTQLKLRKVS